MRRLASLAIPSLLAGSAIVGMPGTASAAAPWQCSESAGFTSYSQTTGALVCWYAGTHTAKICDTAADGYTPYLYAWVGGGNYVDTGGHDPYGAGGCVWYYPPASQYDINGDFFYFAVNVSSNGTWEDWPSCGAGCTIKTIDVW